MDTEASAFGVFAMMVVARRAACGRARGARAADAVNVAAEGAIIDAVVCAGGRAMEVSLGARASECGRGARSHKGYRARDDVIHGHGVGILA